MADLLTSLAGGSTFLVAWLLPSAIVTGSWALLMLPRLSTSGVVIPPSWDTTTKGLVVGFAALAVAFVLAALSTPLYRMLEGYLFWPPGLYNSRTAAQCARKARLLATAKTLDRLSLRADLEWEKADQYPVEGAQIAPTQLGNAIRAMETYGLDRFGLDSQRLWSELGAAAPAALSDAVVQARGQVDFFIAMFYLTILFSLTTLAVFVVELNKAVPNVVDWTSLIVGLGVLTLPWVWYKMAISSVTLWRNTAQAVVNTGRVGLAAQLGLALPETLAEEREMWGRVSSLCFYPAADTAVDILDAYRLKPELPLHGGSDRDQAGLGK